MLNTVVKLTSPKEFETVFEELIYHKDDILVRPTYMSICAADQRYYQGKRKKEILDQKLPLALIHECIGEVIYDSKKEFKKGERVVMIPNTPFEKNDVIKENYLRSSKFRSSSIDGFMQNVVSIKRDRIIPINKIDSIIATQLELTSVAMNALEAFEKKSHKNKDRIAIWGCGSVGYIMGLVLKYSYPNSKIIIVGNDPDKLNYFSYADEIIFNNKIDSSFKVDHAFECVGGPNSEDAIDQIIDVINPQGTICLLGVSEDKIDINTRMVLEKGITLVGNSRSSYNDFYKAVELLQDKKIQDYIHNIISDIVDINDVNDINKAFDYDITNSFKTVMKWNI